MDANVLGHSQDPRMPEYQTSYDFLKCLLGKATVLRVDPGFSLVEAADRSYIGLEYRTHLRHGTLAFSVIQTMAATKRIKDAPDKVSRSLAKKIDQVLANKKDRTYLCVAVNSDEQTFVSHDFADFQIAKRKTIRKEIGVRVVVAAECHPLL